MKLCKTLVVIVIVTGRLEVHFLMPLARVFHSDDVFFGHYIISSTFTCVSRALVH